MSMSATVLLVVEVLLLLGLRLVAGGRWSVLDSRASCQGPLPYRFVVARRCLSCVSNLGLLSHIPFAFLELSFFVSGRLCFSCKSAFVVKGLPILGRQRCLWSISCAKALFLCYTGCWPARSCLPHFVCASASIAVALWVGVVIINVTVVIAVITLVLSLL